MKTKKTLILAVFMGFSAVASGQVLDSTGTWKGQMRLRSDTCDWDGHTPTAIRAELRKIRATPSRLFTPDYPEYRTTAGGTFGRLRGALMDYTTDENVELGNSRPVSVNNGWLCQVDTSIYFWTEPARRKALTDATIEVFCDGVRICRTKYRGRLTQARQDWRRRLAAYRSTSNQ